MAFTMLHDSKILTKQDVEKNMIRMIFLLLLIAVFPVRGVTVESPIALADKGVRMGALLVYPILDIEQQHDSNISKSENDPVSSFKTLFRPSVSVVSGNTQKYFGMQYKLDHGKLWSSSTDTYTDHFIDAFSHHELSSKARVDVGLNYSRSHDQRGSTFTGVLARLPGLNDPDRWHQMSAAVSVGYGHEEARMKLTADGSYFVKRYDNNRLFTASRDVSESSVAGTLYYRVQSKLYLLFDADYGVLDYTLPASLLDSRELTLSTGVTWESTAKTTGTIKIGWRRRAGLSNQVASGLSWDAMLTWQPRSYSTLELSSFYGSSETLGAAGSFVQALRNQLDWSHMWGARLGHAVSAAASKDKYIGTARVDYLTDVSVNLTYAFKPWLEVRGGYTYAARSSNELLSSYKQQILSVAVHVEP